MNKISLYIKQAWTMMRQDRLYSSIYITGTGLSIALTMTLFVILYVKFAPLYPEYKRDRTLIINAVSMTPKDTTSNNFWQSTPNYKLVEKLRELQNIDAVTGIVCEWNDEFHEASTRLFSSGVSPLFVDADYWKVYDFEFLSGSPFTSTDFTAKTKVAVVSKSFAETLFKSTDVLENKFFLDGSEYKIVGVVKDVPSSMHQHTTADLWLPATCTSNFYAPGENDYDLRGGVFIAMTAKSPNVIDDLQDEVDEMMRKHNQQDKVYNHKLLGPDIFWANGFRQGEYLDEFDSLMTYGYILLALLIIPALNLSGMISSNMNRRRNELGIRKTYGATNRQLLTQILWENLFLTFVGGIVGIILSYLILMSTSNWIISLLSDGFIFSKDLLSSNLSAEMLFNWSIFGGVVALCFLLNFLSATIPAIASLRHSIINSLNQKQ